MQLISKKTHMFVNPAKKDEVHTVKPSKGEVVSAPDWIRDDPYFAMVEKDGSVQEVVVKSPTPEPTDTKGSKGKAAAADKAAADDNAGLTDTKGSK
jgi:hypothetical protein